MSDFLSQIPRYLHEFELVSRLAYSTGVLYGSLLFSFLLIYLLPVNITRGLKSSFTEPFFIASILLTILLNHLLNSAAFPHYVLFFVFVILNSGLLISAEFEKQYELLKDNLSSFYPQSGNMKSVLKKSYISHNFVSILTKHHLKFWLALLLFEFVSDDLSGVSGAIKLSYWDWSFSAPFFTTLIVLAFILVFQLLLKKVEIVFVPWRQQS